MRTSLLRIALVGAVAAAPAFAQTSTQPGAQPNNGGNGTANRAAGTATENATRPRTPDAGTGATTTTTPSDSSNAAVRNDDGTRTADQPQPGANSFTEGQARSRIEAAGFQNVDELKKDDQGIWRGRAQRNGQQVQVSLDYQGNVTPR